MREMTNELGSSPLTRGKPRGPLLPLEPRGLIPAHAGKTLVGVWRLVGGGAHPRSRGENYGFRPACTSSQGSSPLTRGKHDVGEDLTVKVGLIPAHAGKTWVRAIDAIPAAAHPRSRGENYTRLNGAGR